MIKGFDDEAKVEVMVLSSPFNVEQYLEKQAQSHTPELSQELSIPGRICPGALVQMCRRKLSEVCLYTHDF